MYISLYLFLIYYSYFIGKSVTFFRYLRIYYVGFEYISFPKESLDMS